MGNVISAATEDASDAGTSQLVVPNENLTPAMDTTAEWIQRASQDEHIEAPLYRLYPSTETFGEQAGWSSPRDHESDSALPPSAPYTPEEKAAPSRPGAPRLISAAPSLLDATRSLPSPARLSPSSDEEQRMLTPLDGGSLPAVTELTSRQASVGLSAASLSAPLSEATLTATRCFPPFARGLLVAGAVLWLVSALLALVTWRLSREPLGSDLAQNVSVLVRQLERLASGSAGGGALAASNDSAARNLSDGTAAAHRMAEAGAAGGHEQPLI